jgi:FMN-dependent NADH-azoreductase
MPYYRTQNKQFQFIKARQVTSRNMKDPICINTKSCHQAPYIDFWLRLIGVHEVLSVVVDNAWNQDHAQSEASLAASKQSVEQIVKGFW